MIDRRLLQNFDGWLLALVAFLTVLGIVNLVSATHAESTSIFSPAVRRQLVSLALGFGALLVVLSFDYRHLERLSPLLYTATLLLLASTLLFAPVTRGSQSWLAYGPLRLQPSEFAKIALILMLARHFARRRKEESWRLRDLAVFALIVAGPVSLIVLQRDMGVAALTVLVGATFLPFVRIPTGAWIGVGLVGAVALTAVWFFALQPYQRSRVLDVVDPGRDPLASGYQANQSRIAVGSGGLLGKGYLEGTQTQLRFLPTQHTDFAFSVLAEEWGFVGSSVVLVLYLTLLLWVLVVARSSRDGFGSLLAVGVAGVLFWPAAINIAMVLGLAPVIGVPLPLFSYGGSSLVATLMAMGLLLSVSMRRYLF
jgi:rod shape determining protein RodA